MAAPAATHAARGGRRGSRGRGGRDTGHVSAVGGAGRSPAFRSVRWAACGAVELGKRERRPGSRSPAGPGALGAGRDSRV